jgi:hypothetical protein
MDGLHNKLQIQTGSQFVHPRMTKSQLPKGWSSLYGVRIQLLALQRAVASTSRVHSTGPVNSTGKDEHGSKVSWVAVVGVALVLVNFSTSGFSPAYADTRATQPSRVLNEFPEALAKYQVHPREMLRFPEFRVPYRRALGPTNARWLSRLDGPATLNRTIQLPEGPFVLLDVCKPNACDTDRALILYRPQPATLWGLVIEGTSQRYLGNPPPSVRGTLRQRSAAN